MHPTEFIAKSVIFSGGLQEKRQLFKRFAAHMKSSSVCFHKFDDRQMLMKGGEFPRQHTENIFTSLPMLAENKQYAKHIVVAVICRAVRVQHLKYAVMFWT